MTSDKELVTRQDLLSIIEDFTTKSSGLNCTRDSDGEFSIAQKADAKKIKAKISDLVDVLSRKDSEGKEFIQINFATGSKVLLTDGLIGFKPAQVSDLDSTKLPKVVTTADLLSVFEAIEEAQSSTAPGDEAETLKKVFNSILLGGEEIGFDLSTERMWLRRLSTSFAKANA